MSDTMFAKGDRVFITTDPFYRSFGIHLPSNGIARGNVGTVTENVPDRDGDITVRFDGDTTRSISPTCLDFCFNAEVATASPPTDDPLSITADSLREAKVLLGIDWDIELDRIITLATRLDELKDGKS